MTCYDKGSKLKKERMLRTYYIAGDKWLGANSNEISGLFGISSSRFLIRYNISNVVNIIIFTILSIFIY